MIQLIAPKTGETPRWREMVTSANSPAGVGLPGQEGRQVSDSVEWTIDKAN